MSIQELSRSFKQWSRDRDGVVAAILVVVSLVSFVLGRGSVSGTDASAKPPVSVASAPLSSESFQGDVAHSRATEGSPVLASTSSASGSEGDPPPIEGGYVASKNGTKYHLPWCSGAGRIKEENRVWFRTKEEAERAGYEPAANCKGI